MLPVDRVIGHREWAPGRKSDPRYDMNWRREGVRGLVPHTATGEGDAELNAEEARLLREVHAELTNRHPDRVDHGFAGIGARLGDPARRRTDTIGGYAVNADARSFETRQLVELLREQLDEQLDRIESALTASGVPRLDGGPLDLDSLREVVTDAVAAVLARVQITTKGTP